MARCTMPCVLWWHGTCLPPPGSAPGRLRRACASLQPPPPPELAAPSGAVVQGGGAGALGGGGGRGAALRWRSPLARQAALRGPRCKCLASSTLLCTHPKGRVCGSLRSTPFHARCAPPYPRGRRRSPVVKPSHPLIVRGALPDPLCYSQGPGARAHPRQLARTRPCPHDRAPRRAPLPPPPPRARAGAVGGCTVGRKCPASWGGGGAVGGGRRSAAPHPRLPTSTHTPTPLPAMLRVVLVRHAQCEMNLTGG